MTPREIIEANNFDEAIEAVLAKKEDEWRFVLLMEKFHVELLIPQEQSKQLEAALATLKGAVKIELQD